MKNDYKKIFWQAGQEITPETFIQADNYICAQQNLIRKLINRQYYGLLPVGDAATPSLIIDAKLKGPDVVIERLGCQGITKGGHLISFEENQLPALLRQKRLSVATLKSPVCYVVLRVKSFEQVLIQPIDNPETPLALPAYELDIKDLANIRENELPFLKIVHKDQNPVIDWNYIPPSMSIRSHPRLMEHFRNVKLLMNEILSLIFSKKSQLVQLIYPVSSLIFDLEQLSLNEPPYYLIQLLRKIVKTTGIYLTSVQKFPEAIMKAPYNHDDIAGLLHSLIRCLQEIKMIIGKEEIVEVEDLTPRI